MKFLSTIPISLWVGAAAVLIILVGWYFNILTVIEVTDSFPYLKISGPLPELHRIEPEAVLAGDQITLHGAKLRAFNPEASRVVIGSVDAKVENWERKAAQIKVRVPTGLMPGQYPVNVQIGERQSKKEVMLEVRLLSEEDARKVASGESILVLVARFAVSQHQGTLQDDLVAQMGIHVERDKAAKDRVLIKAWPEAITGNVRERLREIVKSTSARLILYGIVGSGENFYPRIFSDSPTERVFRGGEQPLKPASVTQLQVSSLDTYEMASRPVKEPLRMIDFMLGLSRYHLGDYDGAQTVLSDLLDKEQIEEIDKASLHLALGNIQIFKGTEILERPQRSEQDTRQGDESLKEGMSHLKLAVQELERLGDDRRYHTAQVYFSMGLAMFQSPSSNLRQKHSQAIDLYEKALQHLDCEHEFSDCMAACNNLGASYEWLASVQWDRGIADDLLEKSLELVDKALQMHQLRERANGKLPEEERVPRAQFDSERAWLCNQRGIAIGHLRRGDRNQNLRDAVDLSEKALPVFIAEEMTGRIALTYNHIGTSLYNQEGDRAALLPKAVEAFEKGLVLVGPDNFPEYYKLLTDNKELAERLIAQGNKMLEGESAARYEAEFDRLFRAGQFPEAKKEALAYLNWAWRDFGKAQRYTAMAHVLLARVLQQAGGVDLALQHVLSARTILSGYSSWDDRQLQQAKDLDRKLIDLAQAIAYDPAKIQSLLHDTANGFRFRSQHKQEGDRLLALNPKEAIAAYGAALSFYPQDPLTLVHRAIAKSKIGDLVGYGDDLSDALRIYPDDAKARFYRAQILLLRKRWDDAVKDLDVAIRASGEDANFYVARAAAYTGLGEKEKALSDYTAALTKAKTEESREDIQQRMAKLKADTVN